MDTQETTMILHEVSNHIGILEYNQLLKDDDISDLIDYDYYYDAQFKGELKNEN